MINIPVLFIATIWGIVISVVCIIERIRGSTIMLVFWVTTLIAQILNLVLVHHEVVPSGELSIYICAIGGVVSAVICLIYFGFKQKDKMATQISSVLILALAIGHLSLFIITSITQDISLFKIFKRINPLLVDINCIGIISVMIYTLIKTRKEGMQSNKIQDR